MATRPGILGALAGSVTGCKNRHLHNGFRHSVATKCLLRRQTESQRDSAHQHKGHKGPKCLRELDTTGYANPAIKSIAGLFSFALRA